LFSSIHLNFNGIIGNYFLEKYKVDIKHKTKEILFDNNKIYFLNLNLNKNNKFSSVTHDTAANREFLDRRNVNLCKIINKKKNEIFKLNKELSNTKNDINKCFGEFKALEADLNNKLIKLDIKIKFK